MLGEMGDIDKNLSAVLYKKRDLRLEDRAIPEPGKGEVQVCMKTVGICGTDLSLYAHGGFGEVQIKSPLVLGHETSGVVSKVGDGVTNLKVGDRVVMEIAVSCLACNDCKEGRYNLCYNQRLLGVPQNTDCTLPPSDGCMSRYQVHPAVFCHRIPSSLPFEEAPVIEPLSVAVRACKRAPVTLGQKVFICGAGPIGLLCLATAKAMGAAEICISDICESRLRLAEQMGAKHTVLVDGKDAEATAEKVNKIMGCKADVTLECVGLEVSVRTGIFATRPGGVYMQVGVRDEDVKIPMVYVAIREVDIKGSFCYVNDFPAAIDMVASSVIDVKPLITHHFPLERAPEAFETARTGKDTTMKVIIHCDRDWKP